MKPMPRPKLKSRHMLYVVGFLALILGALIVAGLFGIRPGEDLMSKLTDGIMITAIGALLFSRKLKAEEARAEEARAKNEEKSGTEMEQAEGSGDKK